MPALRYQPIKYLCRTLALEAAYRMGKHCVMLGDDMRYWVVCYADARRLEAAGFEYAD